MNLLTAHNSSRTVMPLFHRVLNGKSQNTILKSSMLLQCHDSLVKNQ